ncbi:MAG: NAD-dependent epimerase/dehydratase family protein [Pseudomonadota bacterium]|nr:NAD-dependent epimerase/dehydratase family protein [Pseudomonadota bacterium]
MRILILGGSVFVGRALTDAALARGHEVTHFNRGKSAPDEPRVATLHGDRTEAAALENALYGKSWNAVIDTSGYLPQVVKLSAQALRGRVGRYLFVSTISVYAGFDMDSYDEDSPVSPPPDPLLEALDMALYGPLKAGCEQAVREQFGERATIVRPGLIVGPHDPTDRFTYWPERIARGGEVLAPGRPARNVQFIDVRDVAEWMVRLLENNVGGTINAIGPRHPTTMEQVLEACRDAGASDARLAWIDDASLLAAGAGPWKELPLWIPESDPATRGHSAGSLDRALAHGLEFRPLADTVADTLAWSRTRAAGHAWKAGLTPERERALLESVRTGSGPSTAPPPRAG